MPELPGKRVGIVTPLVTTRGGTEVYLQRLIGVQRALGLTTRLFTQDPPGVTAQFERVEVVGCGKALSEGISPRKLLARAPGVRLLADELVASCDWVEFHRLAPLDLLRALRGQVPTLVFQHTAELTCPALGRYLRASGRSCERAPGVACLRTHAIERCMSMSDGTPLAPHQRLRALARGPLTRATAEAATAIVFNSEALRDLFERTVASPARRFVLPPPIDESQAEGKRVANRVVFAGRLEELKGVLDAIGVAATLPETELHVYGAGSAREAAERAARASGAEVRFMGWASSDTLAQAYAEASCVLMPSRAFEPWGMVGLESIAAGCPVVAYDVGGVREWLNPHWGELITPGDVAGLAAATARQLARMREGLDTTGWREQVLQRWGADAYREAYTRTVRAACARDTSLTGAHRPVVRPATWSRRVAATVAQAVERTRTGLARGAQAVLFGRPSAKAARVLVYRLGTIGDHACAVPVLQAIRARHSEAAITLVTEKRGDEPWPVKLGFAEELRLEVREYESVRALRETVRDVRPEALYYLAPQPLSLKRALRDALFFRMAGVRGAAGFGAVDLLPGSARALQPWQTSMPEAQRLVHACGLGAPPSPEARTPGTSVVFAPAGKSSVQHWREGRFIELAHRVSALGYTPVWLGDKADGERLRASGQVPGDDRTGQYTPRELRDVVATAAGVVSNDSGIAHLAALAGTPLLVISSARANAGAWDPWGTGPVRVLRRAMNCEGCRRNECEDVACLHLIGVEEAWGALTELLRARG